MTSRYRVVVERRAEKELDRLPDVIGERIINVLLTLEENPRPFGNKKLVGMNGYRVRQGQYRILYTVDDAERVVHVFRIAHRREAYR